MNDCKYEDQLTLKTVMYASHYKVERILGERFPTAEIDIVDDEECCNDVSITWHVKPIELDDDEMEELISGKGYNICRQLFNQMCFEGLVPEGELFIRVSW